MVSKKPAGSKSTRAGEPKKVPSLEKFRQFADARIVTAENPYPYLPQIDVLQKRAAQQRLAEVLPDAILGRKFKAGRKSGTGGPIRIAVARLLNKTPALKNAEIWHRIKDRPPRGWTAYENAQGKYLEGPTAADVMSYRRFCNVCAEERHVLRG